MRRALILVSCFCATGLPQDKLATARREYLSAGAMPSYTRYGWVHLDNG